MKDQILNLSSRMNFGKHRGETIGQIVDENPSYIEWMIENIDNIAFSEDVVSELDLSDDLVEINSEKLESFEDNSWNDDDFHHHNSYDDDYYRRDSWDAMTDGQYGDMPDGFDGDYRHRGDFPWMPTSGGLAEYLHKAIHEEWQVGHTPYLRAETLHFRVE